MNNPLLRQPGSKESGIVQRVRSSLRELPFDRPHVLLACSAGKDSVALAFVLGTLAHLGTLSLTIAHINHGQHERADEAAAAVEQIGQTLGVPTVLHHLSADAIAAHTGEGLEEALRRERYLALARIAERHNADCIATAHHQGDQAETLLLHLMRGAGVDGLAGMRAWERRGIPWWTGQPEFTIGIWRPLLGEPAAAVAAVAVDPHLPVVEDPTNRDTSFRRNATRHDLLPLMEQISPGCTAAIARSAEVIAADAQLLDSLTAEYMSRCLIGDDLDLQRLVAMDASWQQRVVRRWLSAADPIAQVTHDRIMAVIGLAQRNRGGSYVEVGGGVSVVLRDGVLVLKPWQNTA